MSKTETGIVDRISTTATTKQRDYRNKESDADPTKKTRESDGRSDKRKTPW